MPAQYAELIKRAAGCAARRAPGGPSEAEQSDRALAALALIRATVVAVPESQVDDRVSACTELTDYASAPHGIHYDVQQRSVVVGELDVDRWPAVDGHFGDRAFGCRVGSDPGREPGSDGDSFVADVESTEWGSCHSAAHPDGRGAGAAAENVCHLGGLAGNASARGLRQATGGPVCIWLCV